MRRRIATATVAALLISPAAAFAGAPNYDCAAGNARLSVDQWAGKVAATGFQPGAAAWGTATDIDQAGPSLDLVAALGYAGPPLDLVATLGGASWKIAIRGMGESLTIDGPKGMVHGTCAFVPGNYVLRAADSGGFALRARPAAHARSLLVIRRGAAVWQIPDREQRGRWLPIRAFVVHDGHIRAVDGWLRQREPLVPRYP